MCFDWINELHGKILKELRLKENLTQNQLGEELQITQPIVSQFESGNISPTEVQLDSIIDRFGVPPFVDGSITEIDTHNLLSNWLRGAMAAKSLTVKNWLNQQGCRGLQ